MLLPPRLLKRVDAFWLAALAAVLMILLHQSLFMGKGLVATDSVLRSPPWNLALKPGNYLLSDQYYTFLPTQEFVHQQKAFPLWNPYICCGVPNLGGIQGALLFPIRVLFSPLGPFWASGPSAFLKLCLAGCFTFLYLRLLGVTSACAFLGGVVFSLSGFMIVWLGHPHVNSAIWLPLLLYFVEKSFRETGKKVFRAWAGFSIALAFAILGGHPPTVIHVTIIVFIYFLFRLAAHDRELVWQRAGLLIVAVTVALLLAAPQILPFLEYYRQSSSGMSSVSMARWSHHLNFRSLIHFLLPDVMGSPAAGFEDLSNLLGWPETKNFNERTGYVGILPLFFALYAIAFRRDSFTKFFLSTTAASFLIVLGVPPIPAVLRILPILSDVSEPRLLLIIGFSLAILAALGADELFRARDRRKIFVAAIIFCAVAAGGIFCFWMGTHARLHTLDAAHWSFLRGQFLILAGGVAVVVSLARWSGWVSLGVCLTWAAGDLLFFATGYNPAISRDLYYPVTPAIEWLQKDNSAFRIFGDGSVLTPDTGEVFGISDSRGCDFMTVRRYEELLTGRAGEFYFCRSPEKMPDAFRLLNAKYVVAAEAHAVDPSRYDLVYSNGMAIYRYKAWQDRALVVFNAEVAPDRKTALARVSAAGFDPHSTLVLEDGSAVPTRSSTTNGEGSARIVSYKPDDVQVEASLSQPGYLLLLDTCFPGWSAMVNGKPAPILLADYNFRAVALEPGKSNILFSYRPESLRLGLFLCAAGLIFIVAAWFR